MGPSNYDPNGVQPIQSVEKISHDIPILIACSKQDKKIPYTSSVELYKKLIETGHANAYLLVTEEGGHASMLRETEGDTYRNVVHAFYKKHNLPHNETWAAQGAERLHSCQLTLQELSVLATPRSLLSSISSK